MLGIDFASYSIWTNLAFFAVAAGVVWFAGGQVARMADVISTKTGVGSAFVGVLFLAIATSSPEISTTVTAAFNGNPSLAVSNLLGGIAMQTAILAVVDAIFVRGALTSITPKPVLMLQGVLLTIMLGVTLAGAASDLSFSIWGMGLWPILIFVLYIAALYLVQKYEGNARWKVTSGDLGHAGGEQGFLEEADKQNQGKNANYKSQRYQEWSVRRLGLYFAGGTLLILISGILLATLGDTLAEQTGLGAGFIGVTLLALATSLPELSATIAAAKVDRLDMAVSNIFGSNALMVALLLLADIAYWQGEIMTAIDRSMSFAAAVGIVVTAIYLAGLIERQDRTILRMGIDSLAVIVVYIGSLAVLYLIR